MNMVTARKILLCAVVALLVLSATNSATAQAGGTDDSVTLRSYYSANGLLNRGLYDLAAEEYRAFLADHSGHDKAPDARYGLAVALFRQNMFEDASSELEKLTSLSGFRYAAEVLMVLGQSQLSLGSYDEADDAFEALLGRYADHDLADDAAALQVEARYRNAEYAAARSVSGLFESRWSESPHRERVALFEALASVALGDDQSAVRQLQGHLAKYPEGPYRDQVSLLLAQALHRTEDIATASEQYQSVIRTGVPTYVPDALYGLALLMHQQSEQEQSGRLLDQLLERFPEHALTETALQLRGRTYFELQQYDDAISRYDAAFHLEGPKQDEADYWMAKCELRQGRNAAAAERLERAIEMFSESAILPEMHYDLGVAQLRDKNEQAAVETLSRFRRLYSDHTLDADARHLLVGIYHQRLEYADSLQEAASFLDMYPDHDLAPAVAFLIGENLYLSGQFEAAADAYARFVETYAGDTRTAKASYRQGMSYYQLQRYNDAEPFLSEAVTRRDAATEFPLAALALGDSYFQQSRWDDAIRQLRQYLQQAPDATRLASADDALLKLGMAYQRTDSYDDALGAFETLTTTFPESAFFTQAIFEAGQSLVALNRLDDARNAFERVLEDNADGRFMVFASNHLGAIAFRQEQFVEAASHYQRVAELADEDNLAIEATFQRGRALMADGSYADAAQAFASVVSGYADHDRHPESMALQAISLARADQHEQALAVVARVEELGDGAIDNDLRSTLRYEQAWALRELDRADEAMAVYGQLLDESQDPVIRGHTIVELSEMHANRDEFDRAAELLKPFVTGSNSADVISDELLQQAKYQLGINEYQLKRYEPAVEILEEFLSGHAEARLIASAHLISGESLYHLGSHERAIEHLKTVVRDHSGDETYGPGLLRLGECLALLQLWDASQQSFERFLNDLPEDSQWFQARFGVAWAMENRGELDKAIQNYRSVVDNHAGQTAARAQFQIGECLFAKKEYEVAARELLKVDILYAYPQWSAAALYEAARCFQAMNDPVKARAHFRMVMESHDKTEWATMASQRLEEMARTTLPGRSSGG